jgi:hypothetical protein
VGEKNACSIFVGETEGEIPLGTRRRKFDEYIGIDMGYSDVEYIGIDIGYSDVECIHLDHHKNS